MLVSGYSPSEDTKVHKTHYNHYKTMASCSYPNFQAEYTLSQATLHAEGVRTRNFKSYLANRVVSPVSATIRTIFCLSVNNTCQLKVCFCIVVYIGLSVIAISLAGGGRFTHLCRA